MKYEERNKKYPAILCHCDWFVIVRSEIGKSAITFGISEIEFLLLLPIYKYKFDNSERRKKKKPNLGLTRTNNINRR